MPAPRSEDKPAVSRHYLPIDQKPGPYQPQVGMNPVAFPDDGLEWALPRCAFIPTPSLPGSPSGPRHSRKSRPAPHLTCWLPSCPSPARRCAATPSSFSPRSLTPAPPDRSPSVPGPARDRVRGIWMDNKHKRSPAPASVELLSPQQQKKLSKRPDLSVLALPPCPPRR